MKSLKGHLEEVVQWQHRASKLIFDVGTRIGDLKIPMSPSIFKRIWPDSFRATVFHVTDAKNFPGIVKLQGKKSSISAFFEMQSHFLKSGVQTLGGVIVELDANILMSGSQDMMSAPDKSGRRWVDLSFFNRHGFGGDISKIEKSLEDLVKGLVYEYMPGQLGKIDRGKLPIHWQNLGYKVRDDKMAMRDLIKDYIDGVEIVIKRHQEDFKRIFYGYMKKRATDESWDEQIVNNFKIIKVHLLPDTRGFTTLPKGSDNIKNYGGFVKQLKDKKIKHAQWRDTQALEIYIRDVARKGIGSSAAAEQDKIDKEFAERQKEVLADLRGKGLLSPHPPKEWKKK